VLHGIHAEPQHTQFATRDVDFFLGRNYLVTVHDGDSRSINAIREVCNRHEHILKEGPVALMHRTVDRMIDNYRPVFEEIEARVGRLEEEAFAGHERLSRRVMRLKRDVSSMRRVLVPQRDAIGRLARREFPMISDEMTYRFRDVYDHVVRLTEEAILFQDRITGHLRGQLSSVSNRLNQVMKLLTVMSTIFLPLTVLTGMWGMNITIPHFPGGPRGAVLVDLRSDDRDLRGDAGVLPPQQVAVRLQSSMPRFNVFLRSRQPDRRRRSGRASGVGDQGAGRELDRRRRAPSHHRGGAGRKEAHSCRR
jgi:hypothetical protein